MAGVVVRLYVVEVDCRGYSRHAIEFAQVGADGGKRGQELAVGLEVAKVHGVKTNQRGKQAPVRFRELLTRQVALFRQDALNPIQCVEQLVKRFLVGGLACGKARAVYTVVDVRVYTLIQPVDVPVQRLGVVVVVVAGQVIKGAVEHADNFRGLIADNGFCVLVP